MSPRFVILLASIAVIPLVFTTGGIDPAFSVRLILLAVVAIVLAWAIGRRQIAISPLPLALFALSAFTIISIAIAQNSGEAIYGSAIVLLYLVFFIVAREVVAGKLHLIARACTVLALIIAAIGLAQFYDIGFSWVPSSGPPSATMTTKNLLSSFLLLLIPFILYTGLRDERRWQFVAMFSWLFTVLTILIAQTRAVWLASIVFAALTLLGTWFFIREQHALVRPASLLGAIAVACLAYVTIFHVSSRVTSDEPRPGAQTRPFMSYTPSDTSASMRLNVWKESMQMLRDHPFGVGAGNWKIALPAYGLASFPKYVQDGSSQWTHAHNDILEQFAELGILGGIAYLAIFILGVLAAIRAIRRVSDASEKLFFVLLGAAVAGFGVISFFDFPKARVEHMMIFMLVLALLDKFGGRQVRSIGYQPIVFTVLALPALYFGGLHFIAETHEHNIVELRQEQDWPAVTIECNKIYSHKLLTIDELATPIMYYQAEAEFMQNDLNSALRDNLAALEAHPNHIYTLNNTGSCYTRLGNFDSARVFYTRAITISPNFEESLLNLTAVYYNQHDYTRAMQYVSRCDTTQNESRAQGIARMVRAKLH